MTRPSKASTWLKVARVIAEQSTCLRRAVGCVLVNEGGHVLSTGWNGVASGEPHCNQGKLNVSYFSLSVNDMEPGGTVEYPHACPGAKASSGTNLDWCGAIHAEQNAIAFCRNVMEIDTCYITTSPCTSCVKLLLSTGCKRIIFTEEYVDQNGKKLWEKNGRIWLCIP